MATDADADIAEPRGTFAPLREPIFRNIWTASLLSNFGQLFLGVGAAWEMTRLSSSPSMVALVQTALMIPLMLISLPAGAVADMFDRRKIAMFGLAFSSICGAVLATIAFFDLTTPWLLLLFCVLIGAGVALYGPSWQASIPEQVSRANLPAAVSLGTISYNVARSFGPALGGLIVLAAGVKAVFALNAAFYLPLLLAFFFWRRRHVPSRLPPERMDRAIMAGVRYAFHSPPLRSVLLRVFVFGLSTVSVSALAPLIAKDMLDGDAATYGILLGAQGIGAVLGALFVADIRARMSTEAAVRLFAVGAGIALFVIGVSHSLPLSCAAFALVGACTITNMALLNVSLQLTAPRWVTARTLSLFSSAITAGAGLGAWLWGELSSYTEVGPALMISGGVTIANLLLTYLIPLSADDESGQDSVDIGFEPELELGLTMRSGPIVVEVEYDVEPEHARDFYAVMMNLQRARKRIGGFDWSISRDVANPALWIERYHCPTWGDYLRMRGRYTHAEAELQTQADSFDRTGEGHRVRRLLERPFGSVRWRADSPDPYQGTVGYIVP